MAKPVIPKTPSKLSGIKHEIGESLVQGLLGDLYQRGAGFNSMQGLDAESDPTQTVQNTGLNTMLGSIDAFKNVMDDEYKRVTQMAGNIPSSGVIAQGLQRVDYNSAMINILRTIDSNVTLIDNKARALDSKFNATKKLVDYNTSLLTKANLVLNDIKQISQREKYNSTEASMEAKMRNKVVELDNKMVDRVNKHMAKFAAEVNQRLDYLENNQRSVLGDVSDYVKTAGAVIAESAAAKFLSKHLGTAIKVGGSAVGAGVAGGLEYYDTGNTSRAVTQAAGTGLGTFGGAAAGFAIGGPVGALIGGVAGSIAGSYAAEFTNDQELDVRISTIDYKVKKLEELVKLGRPARNEFNVIVTEIDKLKGTFRNGQLPEPYATQLGKVESQVLYINQTYNIDGANLHNKAPLGSTHAPAAPAPTATDKVITNNGLTSYAQREELQSTAERLSAQHNVGYFAGFSSPGLYMINAETLDIRVKNILGLDEFVAKSLLSAKADLGAGSSQSGGVEDGGFGANGPVSKNSSSDSPSPGPNTTSPNESVSGPSPSRSSSNPSSAPSSSRSGSGSRDSTSTGGKPIEGDIFNRGKHAAELSDDQVKERLFAITMSEVGPNGKPEAQRALMETIFNRTDSRGRKNLLATMDPNYYAPFKDGSYERNLALLRRSPELRKKLEQRLEEVIKGSNDSNYATDNSSAGVAANARRTQTVTGVVGGETFSRKDRIEHANRHGLGVTKQDQAWYKQMQEREAAAREAAAKKSSTSTGTKSEERRQGDIRPDDPKSTGSDATRVGDVPSGKIRSRDIQGDLKNVLGYAAGETDVKVEIVSGGQMSLSDALSKGAVKDARGDWWLDGKKVRTGTVRHDDGGAADVKLYREDKDGNKTYLSMDNAKDRVIMKRFVEKSAEAGGTGFGAGSGYMGDKTIHVGYGKEATWGGADWVAGAAAAGAKNRDNFSMEEYLKRTAEKPDANRITEKPMTSEEKYAKNPFGVTQPKATAADLAPKAPAPVVQASAPAPAQGGGGSSGTTKPVATSMGVLSGAIKNLNKLMDDAYKLTKPEAKDTNTNKKDHIIDSQDPAGKAE